MAVMSLEHITAVGNSGQRDETLHCSDPAFHGVVPLGQVLGWDFETELCHRLEECFAPGFG